LRRQAAIDAIKARFEARLEARELTQSSHAAYHALGALKELEAIHPQDPFITEGRRRIALVYGDLAKERLSAGAFAEARHWLTTGETLRPGLKALATLADEIRRAEAAAQDEFAYAQARRINLRESYEAYLDHCKPLCGHKREAQAALEQLKSSPPSSANRLFRDPLTNGGQGPEMILIVPGAFIMGSPPDEAGRFNDEHQHQLSIERPFAIGRYEVTFTEYDRFAEATGRQKPDDEGWGRERRPVINVSWEDAVEYTQWLSAQTGSVYRLPTEAEWEYAARAGSRDARYWGSDPGQGCDYANAADLTGKVAFTGWTVMHCRDGYVYTAPVGQYQANALGLFDMLGNVLEWTCTAYQENFQGPYQECSDGEGVTHMVARGGSWSDPPRSVRSADRHKALPEFRDYFLGFRVLRLL
jgi:formylglycine-generating enzyme required for sulfatase activity